MNTPATNPGNASHPRDAIVTGMGFCLPGEEHPVFTAGDLWDITSRGATCLDHDGIYYGSVNLTDDMFNERLPHIPPFFSAHYTNAHRYGLVSLTEACTDAQLDIHNGDLNHAAILVGRGGIDANINSYLSVLNADPHTTTAAQAMELFVAAEQAITPSDVALVQGALTQTNGPCYTLSCGCASSALQIGHARTMIRDGEADIVAVTGVDVFNINLIQNIQNLLHGAQHTYNTIRTTDMPTLLPSFNTLMRPYDQHATCINHGEGSATLILESRQHATQRGAHPYGQVLNQTTTRDGLANPLASDHTGKELVNAIRRCLRNHDITHIPYIHGASDGNPTVTQFEANAITTLYGPTPHNLLMTSHEGTFGHNGAPAGCISTALTLLMMQQQQICPTTNCQQPATNLPFDPIPGTHTRPLTFHHALTLNYQIGGLKSATHLTNNHPT